ncbi:MAG: YaiO family outer membrane beta-barrel protein [Microbacter sp.]
MKQLIDRVSLLLCFLSVSFGAFPQVNVDSIFNVAIQKAKNQNYAEALRTARVALEADPKRSDILVFIANVYSWENKNDSAVHVLHQAKAMHYEGADLYETWMNVLLRTHQYQSLLQMCDEALRHGYPDKGNVLRKQLIAYSDLKQYNQAVRLIKAPENKSIVKDSSLRGLITDIYIKRNTNILSAYYTLDWFDHFTPQHLGTIDYSTKFGNNTGVIHANLAHRFGLNDFQLEADFYLYLNKKQYMYFNYGYAFNASLFPQNRIGYEDFLSFNHGFEVSFGGRYMQYLTSKLFIVTAHVGKYLGKNWVSLRPFYVIKKGTQSLSFIADYRLYGSNQFNYWGVQAGFGNSPDDIYATAQSNGFNQLNAYKIELSKNLLVNHTSEFHVGLAYTREEFFIGRYRNRYTLEAGYKIHLK